ncbi:MAG: biliverdin-producing heme oxygenase [Verrucomicrobiaceae bacterium]
MREKTASAHRELDEGLEVERIVASREPYLAYLEGFRDGFLETCGMINWSELSAHGAPDLERRQERFVCLFHDISELKEGGGSPPDLSFKEGGATGFACSLGAFYVLEGSVHGGHQILKLLQQNVVDLREEECGFVKGFGGENGPFWKRFCVWMDSVSLDPSEQEVAVEAALQTFGIFKRNFQDSDHLK